METDDVATFTDRLSKEWLPTFCDDPKRKYPREAFRYSSIKVTPEDARDFMQALDLGIVTDRGGGRFYAARTTAFEQLFWNWNGPDSTRVMSLWMEPVITIAAVARLHLHYGWPKECLGTQSKWNWAFDLFAVKPGDEDHEYIAGEVKKSVKEVEQLITFMRMLCVDRSPDAKSVTKPRRNAHKKWLALSQCRASLFWVVGPGKYSRLFRISHAPDGPTSLDETTDDSPLQFEARPS